VETWQGLASKMPCAKETWSDPGAESNLLSVSCQIEPPTPTLPTLFLHGMPNIPETSHQAGGEAVLLEVPQKEYFLTLSLAHLGSWLNHPKALLMKAPNPPALAGLLSMKR
jgi:hypothetical protein